MSVFGFNRDDHARVVRSVKYTEGQPRGIVERLPSQANLDSIRRGKTTSVISARGSGMVGANGTEWTPGGGTAQLYNYDRDRNRVVLGNDIGVKNDLPYAFPSNTDAFFGMFGGATWIMAAVCSGTV